MSVNFHTSQKMSSVKEGMISCLGMEQERILTILDKV